jgi:hypothetical protein
MIMFGSEFLTYSYQPGSAQNITNRRVTLRAYMKTTLTGKMIKQHSGLANRTRIEDLINTVQKTRPIEIMTVTTIANDH